MGITKVVWGLSSMFLFPIFPTSFDLKSMIRIWCNISSLFAYYSKFRSMILFCFFFDNIWCIICVCYQFEPIIPSHVAVDVLHNGTLHNVTIFNISNWNIITSLQQRSIRADSCFLEKSRLCNIDFVGEMTHWSIW